MKKTDEIKIVKNGWDSISINDYYSIMDILNDEALDSVTKDVNILSILCERTPEEIYNLSVDDVGKLMNKIEWIKNFKWNKKWKAKHIKIAGRRFTCCVDTQEMTISQFIDFQTFFGKNDLRTYYGNILACFLVPEGKRYCEDYDGAEVAEFLRDNVSIVLANEIVGFFFRNLILSYKAMVIYLTWLTKRMRKRKHNTPEIQRMIKDLEMKLATARSSFVGWL